MGACCGLKSSNQVKVPLPPPVKPEKPEPVKFEKENFKLEDYTRKLSGMSDIEELRDLIPNYRPTDIRCARGTGEKRSKHSFVILTGVLSEETFEDIM